MISYLIIPHLSTLNVVWTLVELDDVILGSIQVGEQLLVLLLLGLPVPAVSLHPALHGLLLPARLGLNRRGVNIINRLEE